MVANDGEERNDGGDDHDNHHNEDQKNGDNKKVENWYFLFECDSPFILGKRDFQFLLINDYPKYKKPAI